MHLQAVNSEKESTVETLAYLNGAAIIDDEGNEIPITEFMILNACHCSNAVWPLGPFSNELANG